MKAESLVVIRNCRDMIEADEAQIALMSAGIYALIFADESVSVDPGASTGKGIAVAVHQRDVMLAEGALTARPHPA